MTPGSGTRRDPWRRYRTPWRVLGTVVAVVMLVAGVVRVVGALAERDEPVDELVAAEGIALLRVEVSDSTVEVVGADVAHIRVTGTVTSGLRRGALDVDRSGDRVLVTLECGPGPSFQGCDADLLIEVPRGLDVSIDVPNSEVALVDLDGAVDASTTNTSMSATALGGDLRLRATNGSIRATGLSSAHVDAATSNDDVELEFVQAPRTVTVRSTNGSATVVVPDTDVFYALELRTSNGDTTADVRADPDSDRRVRVTTSNDDIVVRYPG